MAEGLDGMLQKTVVQNRRALKVSRLKALQAWTISVLSRKVQSRPAGVCGGPQVRPLRAPFLSPTSSLPQHVISNNLDHMGTLDGHFDNEVDFAGSEGLDGMEVDHSKPFVPVSKTTRTTSASFRWSSMTKWRIALSTVIHEHIERWKSLYTSLLVHVPGDRAVVVFCRCSPCQCD